MSEPTPLIDGLPRQPRRYLPHSIGKHCTDDHSADNPTRKGRSPARACPVHGFDQSIPPPKGWAWHDIVRADGSVFTAVVPEPPKPRQIGWEGDRYREIAVKPERDEPDERPWWRFW